MRYPGENAARPEGDTALFAPGYAGSRRSRRNPAHARPAAAAPGRRGAVAGGDKGPVRGFPPAPGQPPPQYPPGPFAAWNRAPADPGNDPWLAGSAAVTATQARETAGEAGPDWGHAAPGRDRGARGHGSRGRARPRQRSNHLRAALLGIAVVVAGAAVAAHTLYGTHHAALIAASGRVSTSTPPSRGPSPRPSSSLGPWQRIASRAVDPAPLTLTELFPAEFSNGTASYIRTVDKAKTHCAAALIGSQLISGVNRAGCTQVMRASYLSGTRSLMGTIGVLNLVTAAAAKAAGKAAGASGYIAQLPAAKGPTRSLTKGTGIEAAEVKGHYLVLVWAEFANLHAPGSAAQRAELESFISLLMQKTANVSLASRMVTGTPAA